jgi:hypothetical protein
MGRLVCGEKLRRKRLFFSLGAKAAVFQEEFFIILPCAREYTERKYARRQCYICSELLYEGYSESKLQ